jgi:hypothetical protein
MVHLSLSIGYLISKETNLEIYQRYQSMIGPLEHDLDVLLYTNANTKPSHQNKN